MTAPYSGPTDHEGRPFNGRRRLLGWIYWHTTRHFFATWDTYGQPVISSVVSGQYVLVGCEGRSSRQLRKTT